jgi:hypothetical protein
VTTSTGERRWISHQLPQVQRTSLGVKSQCADSAGAGAREPIRAGWKPQTTEASSSTRQIRDALSAVYDAAPLINTRSLFGKSGVNITAVGSEFGVFAEAPGTARSFRGGSSFRPVPGHLLVYRYSKTQVCGQAGSLLRTTSVAVEGVSHALFLVRCGFATVVFLTSFQALAGVATLVYNTNTDQADARDRSKDPVCASQAPGV